MSLTKQTVCPRCSRKILVGTDENGQGFVLDRELPTYLVSENPGEGVKKYQSTGMADHEALCYIVVPLLSAKKRPARRKSA